MTEHPRHRLRPKSRFQHRMQRAVESRRVFPYLAAATLLLGVGTGFVMTLIDKRDFPTFGDGVWWAVVTLGTVGYGDIVPHTAWGRVLGSIVIVFGVTFISFLTATVTSLFVSADQEERTARRDEARAAQHAETHELLVELRDRLAAIERRLDAQPRADEPPLPPK